MALASQKVDEFTKEDSGFPRNDSNNNDYYQESGQKFTGWNSSSSQQFTSASCASWDDWDVKDNKNEEPSKGSTFQNGDSWAGWDDSKDDGFDDFHQSPSDKNSVGYNGKSDSKWSGAGFL